MNTSKLPRVALASLVTIFAVTSAVSQEQTQSATQQLKRPVKDELFTSQERREFIGKHSFKNPAFRQKQIANSKGSTLAQGSRQVRMVYLVPSDKSIRADYQNAIAGAILNLQLFYKDQLNGQTFSVHSPSVEVYQLSHPAAFYSSGDNAGPNGFAISVLSEAFALTGGGFEDPNNRWIVYIDADPICGQVIGGTAGLALLAANDLRGLTGQPNMPACASESPDLGGVNRWIGGLGHELGHAFNLPHPPGCDQSNCAEGQLAASSLMWAGYAAYPNTYLLDEDKTRLLASGFFNTLSLDPSAKYNITGTVKINNTPISGVTILISEIQIGVVSDINGNFNFSDLPSGGNYTVSAVKSDVVFAPVIFNNLDRDQVVNLLPREFSISGQLTGRGSPIAGVTVTLTGATNAVTTTNGFGSYSFPAVLAAGTYTVKPLDTSIYTFASQAITVLDSHKTINFVGTAKSFAITGQVSLNNNGMPGVTVFLTGTQTANTTTGANGTYSFSGLAADGSYMVIPAKTDYSFTPQSQIFNTLVADQVVNFHARLNPGIPILISEENSTRALSLDSVLRIGEPFQRTYQHPWSPDRGTRIMLFATNFALQLDETSSAVTAEAEDSTHTNHFLPVEYVGKVPGFDWLNCIIVRLDIPTAGDVLVRIRYRGIPSNRVRVGIEKIGGGLPDDPGAVPTPGRPQQ